MAKRIGTTLSKGKATLTEMRPSNAIYILLMGIACWLVILIVAQEIWHWLFH